MERSRAALFCALAVCAAAQGPAQKVANSAGYSLLLLKPPRADNNTRRLAPTEAMFKVEDKNDRPVAGAVLLFTLPDRGASGTFLANDAPTLFATTDANGVARVRFQPNAVEGKYNLQASYTHEGETVRIDVPMQNTIGLPPPPLKAVTIIGAIGGGTGLLIYAIQKAGEGNDPGRTRITPTTASAGAR